MKCACWRHMPCSQSTIVHVELILSYVQQHVRVVCKRDATVAVHASPPHLANLNDIWKQPILTADFTPHDFCISTNTNKNVGKSMPSKSTSFSRRFCHSHKRWPLAASATSPLGSLLQRNLPAWPINQTGYYRVHGIGNVQENYVAPFWSCRTIQKAYVTSANTKNNHKDCNVSGVHHTCNVNLVHDTPCGRLAVSILEELPNSLLCDCLWHALPSNASSRCRCNLPMRHIILPTPPTC